MAEIKKQAFCDSYKIYVDMEGGVHVEYDGSEVETGKTKSVLREISEKAGFSYEDKWNTRQLGGKLIDFLNEEDLVIIGKNRFQLKEGDFVNNSEETDKQNESKSQEKKYFNIFLNYIGGAVGSFDKDEMLKALKYKDLDEMWEEYSIGLAGECDDYETFIYKVQSIYVEESKTKFENPLLTNSDGGEEYDDGFEIDYFEIPQKGYVVEQYEGPFTKAFIIEVDASEEFDIEELCVNSENEITYKGEKYSSVADDCGSSCGYGGRLSYDGEVLYDDIDSGLDDDDDDDDDDWDDDDWD